MISKRCPNCHKLYAGKKCESCSKKFALANAKKRQTEDEGRKLYGSYRWAKCRRNIILKYMGYDIWLLGVGQLYVCQKPYVHHIVERDEPAGADLIYDEDNLIVVCKESHEEIHQWYKTDKQAALERIEKGKAEFRRIFKDD